MSQKQVRFHQDGSVLLSAGSRSAVYLKNGVLNGIKKSYITKIWNVWDHWLDFYTELYLYAHPKLLRPLQGICIPNFIAVYGAPGGRVNLTVDLPHSVGWRTASPTVPAEEKEAIVEAYMKIHAQGVEHGGVAYRHILIGDDSKVTIIDFGRSKCVSREEGHGLVATTPESLVREMRKVKFLIDYGTARKIEYARTNGNDDILHVEEQDNSPFTRLELEQWEAEGDRDIRFEVRPTERSSSCPEGSIIKPIPRGSCELEFKANLCAPTSASLVQDVAEYSSKREPIGRKKRSRDTLEEDQSIVKRSKVVEFHPDTEDNGLWSTGRPPRKIRRQPTPFIHEIVEKPLPCNSALDIVEWGSAGRPGSSIKSTSSQAWAVTHATEFPPLSIVLTAENGEPKMWQVSEGLFEEVATYIKLRTAERLPMMAVLRGLQTDAFGI